MADELDKRSEAYMRSVMNNDGDVFTRGVLYEYIIEAWKAGYAEGVTTIDYIRQPLYKLPILSRKQCEEYLELVETLDTPEREEMMKKATETLFESAMRLPEAYAGYLQGEGAKLRVIGAPNFKLSKDD